MNIEDLLSSNVELRRFGSQPEMDPLSEEDALQEAQLLDVRFDALRSTASRLFELRVALQLRSANSGVLVARGVRELAWTTGPRSTVRTAWSVLDSVPRNANRLFGLRLSLWPNATLTLVAESAAFFAGDVPGLDAIPDYADTAINANIAGWHSEFIPVHAVFLDPAPATF